MFTFLKFRVIFSAVLSNVLTAMGAYFFVIKDSRSDIYFGWGIISFVMTILFSAVWWRKSRSLRKL